jgi:hypothetical protein
VISPASSLPFQLGSRSYLAVAEGQATRPLPTASVTDNLSFLPAQFIFCLLVYRTLLFFYAPLLRPELRLWLSLAGPRLPPSPVAS